MTSAAGEGPPGSTLRKVVARLTGVNIVVAAIGIVTGSIQAQVLGPSGRGDVAAVVMPLAISVWVLDFGLTVFVARARATGRRAAEVYGTVVPLSCAFSLLGVAAAVPVAHLLGQGRDTVILFLEIGLVLSPVSVALLSLNGALWGEERWRRIGVIRIAAPALTAAALVVLALIDHLTVTTTIVSFLVAGLLSSMLVLPAVLNVGRWRYDPVLAREALSFGAHNWLAGIAVVGNLRLDQLLMAGIVSSRQLGLYAVATTAATFSSVFVGALTYGLFPRMARGEPELARRACRVVLGTVALASVVAALVFPFLIPLLFGSGFDDAVPMALILLVAGIGAAFVTVLGISLSAAGNPRATVRPQVLGLAIAIPLLIVVLPSRGGVGAALVAVLSGAVSAALMLAAGRREFGGRRRDYLLPTGADVSAVRQRLRRQPPS
jgi:O-antigen/teichoic acid export membrane protein